MTPSARHHFGDESSFSPVYYIPNQNIQEKTYKKQQTLMNTIKYVQVKKKHKNTLKSLE